MTSVPSAKQLLENPYHDRIEGDVLVCTGAGRLGHQELAGPNARIVQQQGEEFPIYGFMLLESRRGGKLGPKRWAFLGLLEYLRHYPEKQLDSSGATRLAWMFEMRIFQGAGTVCVSSDKSLMQKLIEDSHASMPHTAEEREVTDAFDDDPLVAEKLNNENIRRKLLSYGPNQFEFVLKELLTQSGFARVEVTKYSQDGGIDVNAYPGALSWPIRDLLVQLQAKRWLHTVGRKEVAELRGSLLPHARGCIVTTSHYSKAAIIESRADGKAPIVLINGNDLANIISVHRFSLP